MESYQAQEFLRALEDIVDALKDIDTRLARIHSVLEEVK